MPKSKYDTLKALFDEACRTKTVLEFIKTIETQNKNSHITYFFLGCAYDFIGQSDKAYDYYLLTVKQANRDKSTVHIVQGIQAFIKKTGHTDLNEFIVTRRLPGAVISQPKKSGDSEPKVKFPTKPQPKKTPASNEPKVKKTVATQPKKSPDEAEPKVKTPPAPHADPKAKKTATTQPKKSTDGAEPKVKMSPAPQNDPKAKKTATTQPKKSADETEPKVKMPTVKKPKTPPVPVQSQKTPEQSFKDAKIALTNKKIDLAMGHLEEAYKGGLRSAQFLYVLSQTLQRQKRYDEAVIYLEMGLSLYPDVDNQILLMNLLAQIYSSQKKRTEALTSYEELVNLYTQKGDKDKKRFAQIQIVNLYRKSEQYDQAQTILQDLLTEFPQDSYLLQLQEAMQSPLPQLVSEDVPSPVSELSVEEAFIEAKEAFEDNELNKVLEILEYVYNAGFISAEFIHILTETFYRLGRYDNALSYLDEGIKQYRDTDNQIAFLTRKGQIYVTQKRWADAVTIYEVLLRLHDDKERNWQRYFILIEMMKLYRKLGQSQAVTSVLKNLMDEFPDEPFTRHIHSKLQADDDNTSAIMTVLEDAPIQLTLADGRIDPVNLMLLDSEKKGEYTQRITHDIEDLIVSINETASHHKTPMIFTPTNRDAIIYRYLRTPVRDRETFTHFASHLYLLIFDRTQTMIRKRPFPLGLLPPEFQKQHLFVKEVDAIRHFYGNAHITDSETWQAPQSSIPVGDVLDRYLGSKKSPHDSQFIDLQYGLLKSLLAYLDELHQHIAQSR